MSLKTMQAHGDLVQVALAVFEARNRVKGGLAAFRTKNRLAAFSADVIAKAFPAATKDEVVRLSECAANLEKALVALDAIADALPANDLPAGP